MRGGPRVGRRLRIRCITLNGDASGLPLVPSEADGFAGWMLAHTRTDREDNSEDLLVRRMSFDPPRGKRKGDHGGGGRGGVQAGAYAAFVKRVLYGRLLCRELIVPKTIDSGRSPG